MNETPRVTGNSKEINTDVPRGFAVYVKIIFRFLSLKLECLGKVQWIMYSVINPQGDKSSCQCLR